MNNKMRDVFTVIVGVFSVIGVVFTIYFGVRTLRDPGIKVEGVDALIQSTQEGTQATRDVQQALTPADPVEALFKRGYTFDRNAFWRATRSGDLRSIALFCAAGGAGWIAADDLMRRLSDPVVATLRQCHGEHQTIACEGIPTADETADRHGRKLAALLSHDADHGLITLSCGRSFERKAKAQVTQIEQRAADKIKQDCDRAYASLVDYAATADSESWNDTSATGSFYESRLSTFSYAAIGPSLRDTCKDTFGLDFEQPRRDMFKRWENGGKSKP